MNVRIPQSVLLKQLDTANLLLANTRCEWCTLILEAGHEDSFMAFESMRGTHAALPAMRRTHTIKHAFIKVGN